MTLSTWVSYSGDIDHAYRGNELIYTSPVTEHRDSHFLCGLHGPDGFVRLDEALYALNITAALLPGGESSGRFTYEAPDDPAENFDTEITGPGGPVSFKQLMDAMNRLAPGWMSICRSIQEAA